MSTADIVTILLRGIRAWGRHGADPGETDVPQPFDVDVMLGAETAAACASDDLHDAVDYAVLHRRIVETVGGESCALLERLAQRILDAVMEDARVRYAMVSIAKPGLLGGATPSVSVSASRVDDPAP